MGTSAARVDIPAKATGETTYVHDMRLPNMLHGRVVRPPYAGYDSGEFVGTSLLAVDETSIAHIPGIVKLVVIGDFIGIVAEREEQAIKAAQALQVSWKDWRRNLPQMTDVAQALRDNPHSTGWCTIPAMWTRRWRRPTGVSPAATCGRISCMPRLALPARWRTTGRSACRSGQAARTRTYCAPIWPAAGIPGSADRDRSHGGGRLLWPQLRR